MITIKSNINISEILSFKKIKFDAKYNPSTQVGEILRLYDENITEEYIKNNFETWKQEYLNYVPTLETLEKRRKEYPPITEQLDMMYWDKVNGTDNFLKAIQAVKAKYPKE